MNRIVRDHYPSSKLPADLREGLPEGVLVRVSVSVEPPKETRASLKAELGVVREGLHRFRKGSEIDQTIRMIRDGGELE